MSPRDIAPENKKHKRVDFVEIVQTSSSDMMMEKSFLIVGVRSPQHVLHHIKHFLNQLFFVFAPRL